MAKNKQNIRKSQTNKITKRFIIFAGLVVTLLILGKLFSSKLMTQSGIYEIRETLIRRDLAEGLRPERLPNSGCYYMNIQCVSAPCEPILVCNSPTPYQTPTTTSFPSPSILRPTPTSTSFPSPSILRPTPNTSPIASTSPSCRSRIAMISMSGRCNSTGFNSYSYQCIDGSVINVSPGECRGAFDIHRLVTAQCGTSCNY